MVLKTGRENRTEQNRPSDELGSPIHIAIEYHLFIDAIVGNSEVGEVGNEGGVRFYFMNNV